MWMTHVVWWCNSCILHVTGSLASSDTLDILRFIISSSSVDVLLCLKQIYDYEREQEIVQIKYDQFVSFPKQHSFQMSLTVWWLFFDQKSGFFVHLRLASTATSKCVLLGLFKNSWRAASRAHTISELVQTGIENYWFKIIYLFIVSSLLVCQHRNWVQWSCMHPLHLNITSQGLVLAFSNINRHIGWSKFGWRRERNNWNHLRLSSHWDIVCVIWQRLSVCSHVVKVRYARQQEQRRMKTSMTESMATSPEPAVKYADWSLFGWANFLGQGTHRSFCNMTNLHRTGDLCNRSAELQRCMSALLTCHHPKTAPCVIHNLCNGHARIIMIQDGYKSEEKS